MPELLYTKYIKLKKKKKQSREREMKHGLLFLSYRGVDNTKCLLFCLLRGDFHCQVSCKRVSVFTFSRFSLLIGYKFRDGQDITVYCGQRSNTWPAAGIQMEHVRLEKAHGTSWRLGLWTSHSHVGVRPRHSFFKRKLYRFLCCCFFCICSTL